jgi:hypothetical protein
MLEFMLPEAGEKRYSLSAPSIQNLVGTLINEHPLRGEGRFGCYHLRGTSRFSDIARSVECRVFQHFFGNTAAAMQAAYGPYEQSSQFFLMVDRQEKCSAGTLRIIENSLHGLKTLNDIALPPLCIPEHVVRAHHGIESFDKCWDIGTLAVLKEYRGQQQDHTVGTSLYGVLHRAARQSGVDHAVTILDRHAYAQLTQMLAVPFEPIAGSQPFDYLGSTDSRAAYLHFPKVVPRVEKHMGDLDEPVRASLRPYIGRAIYAEGVSEVVSVPEIVRAP